jgi:hypothetical protein
MRAMSPDQRAKWERTRAKGFRWFLWLHGCLGWGVTTGVLWWGTMTFFQPTPHPLRSLLGALVVFPLGGLVWGAWVWRIAEKRYAAGRGHEAKRP